jgi:hypothetical protein
MGRSLADRSPGSRSRCSTSPLGASLGRSIDFYRDRVPVPAQQRGPSGRLRGRVRARAGRGALLAIGDGELHTRLDLIQWLEPEARFPDTPPAATAPRIIAIRVENVRGAYQELRARGIEFITPPRGPDAPTGIEAVVCCRDPDRTVVEQIEYMPGVLGSRIDSLARRSS